jgi:aldehyde:ferredoxin oxidoreductase
MGHGYNGKILRVNLSDGTVTTEERDDVFYRRYFGGRGFIAHTLVTEMKPQADALGPDNVLVFATGVFTGAPIGGSGRHSVGAKGPLTGAYADAEVGGYWGAELKQAGFDAIIVTGASKKPVYLWVNDGEAEIRDAEAMWGQTTAVADELIKEDTGEKRARVIQAGPAGERLVRYACVISDVNRAAGRTGLGAVMGSKKLKAIAVRGTQRPEVADKEGLRELAKWFTDNVDQLSGGMRDTGTAGAVEYMHMSNTLPTNNFQAGEFEGAKKIAGDTMRDTILIDRATCFACPVHCKRVVKVEGKYEVDPTYGGPEYETIGAFGSNCGIDNLEAVAKANEMCNAYGVDTISAGVTIAFAMECFEKGLLTTDDTGGIDLRFGNTDSMLEMLQQIIDREGLGKLLGEGSYRAAQEIGKGAEQYAIQVKGQELALQEPRAMHGLGLGYAVSPTGADHCHNMYDQGYTKAESSRMQKVAAMGILEPVPYDNLSPEKVRIFIYQVGWQHTINCLDVCMFMPFDYARMRDIVQAITGWNVTLWEMMKAGERALNLARVFNAREGFTMADDTLPTRFFTPLESDSMPHPALTTEEFEGGLATYYGMMGWDPESGMPTPERLQELDIGWVAEM